MPRNAITLLIVLAMAGLTTAHAGGDPAAGKEKSGVCMACHGADGNGIDPQYPKLAGQYEDYLLYSLKSYKDGSRANVIMAGFVANLSEQDMEDLAAYYASLDSQLMDLDENN